jgi:hypothetical protein
LDSWISHENSWVDVIIDAKAVAARATPELERQGDPPLWRSTSRRRKGTDAESGAQKGEPESRDRSSFFPVYQPFFLCCEPWAIHENSWLEKDRGWVRELIEAAQAATPELERPVDPPLWQYF